MISVSKRTLCLGLAAALTACAPPTRAAVDDSPVNRTLAWTGGERLYVGVAANVRYEQGTDAKVAISGPRDVVDHIVVDRGMIRYERMHWFGFVSIWPITNRDVQIVVTAPRLTSVGVGGAGKMDLGRLAQDRLDLFVSGAGAARMSGQVDDMHVHVSGAGGVNLEELKANRLEAGLSGSGWLKGSGASQTLQLRVSGAGKADFSRLGLNDANAWLSGAGSAQIAPSRSADVVVSGAGNVRLLTQPPQLNVHRSGAGSVVGPHAAIS